MRLRNGGIDRMCSVDLRSHRFVVRGLFGCNSVVKNLYRDDNNVGWNYRRRYLVK